MGLTAKEGGGKKIDPVAAGLHPAVCYLVCDLGTQHSEKFGDKHQVAIGWEIPGERIRLERDGHEVDLPRAITRTYTLSLHDKSTLCKDLVSWRGKAFTTAEKAGFDISKLLGVNCQLQVIHNPGAEGRVYANINSVLPKAAGANVATENEHQYFSLEEHTEVPDNVPQWLRDKIEGSPEWKQLHGEAATGGGDLDGDDDLPYDGPTDATDDDDSEAIPF